MRRALVAPVPIRRFGSQENPGSLWLRMWGSESSDERRCRFQAARKNF